MISLARCSLRALALSMLASATASQGFLDEGPHATGWTDVVAPGVPGGSTILRLRVAYPSTVPGEGAPADVGGAPYPLLVFGHGLNGTPDSYADLVEHVVSWGFVVMAPDTFVSGPQGSLAVDMQGGYEVMAVLQQPGQMFAGLYDPTRVGAFGHSMGGGAAFQLAALEPQIDAVLALAPWNAPQQPPGMLTPAAAAAVAQVPMTIVVGDADVVTPPGTDSLPIYAAAAEQEPLREVMIIPGGDHWFGGGVWEVALDNGVAFLRAYLMDDHQALDRVYGPTAQKSKGFDLLFNMKESDCFLTGIDGTAGRVGIHAAGASGSGVVLLASLGTGPSWPLLPDIVLDVQTTGIVFQTILGDGQVASFYPGPLAAGGLGVTGVETVHFQVVTKAPATAWQISDVRTYHVGKAPENAP